MFKRVRNCGGYKSATMAQKWRTIYNSLGLPSIPHCGFELKDIYKKCAPLMPYSFTNGIFNADSILSLVLYE